MFIIYTHTITSMDYIEAYLRGFYNLHTTSRYSKVTSTKHLLNLNFFYKCLVLEVTHLFIGKVRRTGFTPVTNAYPDYVCFYVIHVIHVSFSRKGTAGYVPSPEICG